MSRGDTTKAQRFLVLDGLRGVAAIAVLLFHLYRNVAPSGYLAVDLFFALSGFVLAHAYEARLKDTMTIRAFMVQRFIRLWPIYIVAMAVGAAFVILDMMKGRAPFEPGALLLTLAANALFIPTPTPLAAVPNFGFPFDRPAWSLFCEVAVNFGFALLLKTRFRFALPLAFLASAVAVLAATLEHGSLLLGYHTYDIPFGIARAGFSFPLGVFLFHFLQKHPIEVNSAAAPALAAVYAVTSVVACHGLWRSAYDLFCVAIIFPTILVIGAAMKPEGALAKACALLGALSYPLYITHLLVQHVFNMITAKLHATPAEDSPILSMVLTAVAIGVAAAVVPLDGILRRKFRRAIAGPRRSGLDEAGAAIEARK